MKHTEHIAAYIHLQIIGKTYSLCIVVFVMCKNIRIVDFYKERRGTADEVDAKLFVESVTAES